MGAETAVLVGSRSLCMVRLAAPVEFSRAAREQRSLPAWPSVWDVPWWNQCQDGSDKLCWGHCTVQGSPLPRAVC